MDIRVSSAIFLRLLDRNVDAGLYIIKNIIALPGGILTKLLFTTNPRLRFDRRKNTLTRHSWLKLRRHRDGARSAR